MENLIEEITGVKDLDSKENQLKAAKRLEGFAKEVERDRKRLKNLDGKIGEMEVVYKACRAIIKIFQK